MFVSRTYTTLCVIPICFSYILYSLRNSHLLLVHSLLFALFPFVSRINPTLCVIPICFSYKPYSLRYSHLLLVHTLLFALFPFASRIYTTICVIPICFSYIHYSLRYSHVQTDTWKLWSLSLCDTYNLVCNSPLCSLIKDSSTMS